MKILVINSGSSSIKFKLFDMSDSSVVCKGLIERIGESSAFAKISMTSGEVLEKNEPIKDHFAGISVMNALLAEAGALKSLDELDGVGHRVVQGADLFSDAVLVDDGVREKIRSLIPLAPLHNPANLGGIEAVLNARPSLANVAVFDTVFHQTMPKSSFLYALPMEFYEKYKVRKYGFHGTSHSFVSKSAAKLLNKDINSFNCITLHLGNGASISAIKDGKCVDTTMGLTPLEGLMMGTRCGSIDPAVVPFMMKNAGLSAEEIDNVMNKKSGLLAICGHNDMREVEDLMNKGDERAKLAFDMFVKNIKKYIGAYLAVLGRVDAIIFTAGIGENDNLVRAAVCDGLGAFGISIDEAKNCARSGDARDISSDKASVKALVIPTDEELAIAQDTLRIIKG